MECCGSLSYRTFICCESGEGAGAKFPVQLGRPYALKRQSKTIARAGDAVALMKMVKYNKPEVVVLEIRKE